MDGRPWNSKPRRPPQVHLATAGAFSELRTPVGQKVYVSSLDVQNAFYNFRIPHWLGMYYGLDPLVASKVGLTSIDNVHISGSQLVYPCMAVLPMGCSWAVYWCQEAHLAILRNSGRFLFKTS